MTTTIDSAPLPTDKDMTSPSGPSQLVLPTVSDDEDMDKSTATPTTPEPVLDDEAGEDPQEEADQQGGSCVKRGVALFLLGFITFVIVDSMTNKYLKEGINSFLEWIEDNPAAGIFVFTIVCFCTTILFIPGILLTLGAGYVFASAFGMGVGMVVGTVAVFVGASSGAMVSFLLGRFLIRDWVTRNVTRRFALLEALDSALEEKGFRIMALLRLSPLIYASPYLNYGVGATSLSVRDYAWSLLALLPATVMFVFLGASADSLTDSANNSGTTIVLYVGIVLSVFAVSLTSYYAKVELNRVVAQRNEEEEAENDVDDDSSGNKDNEDEDDEEQGLVSRVVQRDAVSN